MIFGISGFARTGKDTFALSLEKILKMYEIKAERIAFASVLKKDLQPFLKKHFNIDSFTQNNDEKKSFDLFLLDTESQEETKIQIIG